MKIAEVSATFPPYWGGTGNVAFHNARLLHERGHDVTVFTAKRQATDDLELPFAVERLKPLVSIGNAPLLPGLLSGLAGFDLIHLHYPFIFGSELAIAAARWYRIPLVITYHNRLQDESPLKQGLFALYNRSGEPLALRSSNRIFAVRHSHLQSLGLSAGNLAKVDELFNGVETGFYTKRSPEVLRAELGIPGSAPVVLFVGALDQAHRFKNVEGLLRAFGGLESCSRLVVLGGGDRLETLRSLALDLGLGERVHFLGSRPLADLPFIYSAANVTVLPSTAVESFGMVLIESLSCQTPVIASSLPGVCDTVVHGVDGLLVPPGDEAALTTAMREMLADRERGQLMGDSGRGRVLAEFDWNRIGDRLERLFAEIIAA